MPQRRLASHQLSLPRCSKHDMEKAWKSWRLHQLLSRLEANHIWLYEMRTQDGKQATEKSLLGMTLASQFGCKIVRSWTAKLSPNPAAAASMAAAGRFRAPFLGLAAGFFFTSTSPSGSAPGPSGSSGSMFVSGFSSELFAFGFAFAFDFDVAFNFSSTFCLGVAFGFGFAAASCVLPWQLEADQVISTTHLNHTGFWHGHKSTSLVNVLWLTSTQLCHCFWKNSNHFPLAEQKGTTRLLMFTLKSVAASHENEKVAPAHSARED